MHDAKPDNQSADFDCSLPGYIFDYRWSSRASLEFPRLLKISLLRVTRKDSFECSVKLFSKNIGTGWIYTQMHVYEKVVSKYGLLKDCKFAMEKKW